MRDSASAVALALTISLSLIVPTVFISANIFGSAEEAAAVTWKTFNDRNGLFTIEYPSSWVPTKVVEPLGPVHIDFWYYEKDNSFAYAEIYAAPGTIYATSRDMIEADLAAAESSSDNYKSEQNIECSKHIINGASACSTVDSFDMPDEGQRRVMMVDAVDNSGMEYAFTLTALPALFDRFKPVSSAHTYSDN